MIYLRIYGITFVMAFFYTFFVSESKILDGGLVGLTLIINYITNHNMGWLYFALNVPILLWVYKVDKILFKRSVLGMTFFSVNMSLLSFVPIQNTLPIYFNIPVSAFLLGYCFYAMSQIKASFGGVSPIGVKLQEWNKMKLSHFYLITDIAVLVLGLFFFGWGNFVYSCIFVFIQSVGLEFFANVHKKSLTIKGMGPQQKLTPASTN